MFLKDIQNQLDNDDLLLEEIIEVLRNKMINLSGAHLIYRNIFFVKPKNKQFQNN